MASANGLFGAWIGTFGAWIGLGLGFVRIPEN